MWGGFFKHAELFAINVPLAGFRTHGAQKTGADFVRYRDEAEKALRKYGGGSRGVLWRVIREMARRAPASCWPALAAVGWMHGAKLVTQDPRRGGWTIEKRFI